MIIAANLKMNFNRQQASAYLSSVSDHLPQVIGGHEAIIFVPHCYLQMASEAGFSSSQLSFGAQDCHHQPSGAFTGDVSAEMIADFSAEWVITGHSERRAAHHEADPDVAAKANRALSAGLNVMVCVGEGLEDRQASNHLSFVASQIEAVFSVIRDAGLYQGRRVAVAYEPVWAIGTGEVARAQQISEMHQHIRASLGQVSSDFGMLPLLYGGSVKPDNAAEILALDAVDGALVGGASLDMSGFAEICAAASNCSPGA